MNVSKDECIPAQATETSILPIQSIGITNYAKMITSAFASIPAGFFRAHIDSARAGCPQIQ
jgi:hypothetical protein